MLLQTEAKAKVDRPVHLLLAPAPDNSSPSDSTHPHPDIFLN